MKQKILMLMVGILFIGVNLYAAGDLIVNGKLGAGTSTLSAKINAVSTDESVLNITAGKSSDVASFNGAVITLNGNSASNAGATGLFVSPSSNTAGATGGILMGSMYKTRLAGSGIVDGALGFKNQVHFDTSIGSYTVARAVGQEIAFLQGGGNNKNHTVTEYYGIRSLGNNAGSGAIGGTKWSHAYFENFPSMGGTVTNVSGLWIDNQTLGTNNRGIVLNGDGAGSDIVFGPSQGARIYSESGYLKAQDIRGNVTTFSPHDPVTGEWIFYSKNINTGKTVRVNMEKLVQAVEKLTGETFMVETLIEDK